MSNNVRKQAIQLLETMSNGVVTTGKKGKKEVKDLTDAGKAFIVATVRELGTVSGFTVTDDTTDAEILKAFGKSLVADFAELTLSGKRESIKKAFSEDLVGLEQVYGVQRASEIRSALDVSIDNAIKEQPSATKNILDLTYRILEGVERMGVKPVHLTLFREGHKYHERVKNFNARQMLNFMEVNGTH